MATYGIYDYDFMHYSHVIPNLECAKLCTYFKQHNHIAVLVSHVDLPRFTHTYIRKDYEDYDYPSYFYNDKVTIGGRAFGEKYKPLDLDIENIKPDFLIYEPYRAYFGNKKSDTLTFKKIINAAHVRLSLDEKEINPDYEKQVFLTPSTNTIMVHDYDLAKVNNATDALKNLCERYTKQNGIYRPRRVSLKFPPQVSSDEELREWLDIMPSFETFSFQYNGVMSDEMAVELAEKNKAIGKQMYYNPLSSWYGENDFIERVLPKIFQQILFLRRYSIKILLISETDNLEVDERILNLLKLFRSFGGGITTENGLCSLFRYITSKDRKTYLKSPTTEEIRSSFQYIREKNYDLFRAFYEEDRVNLKGGEFIYYDK